MNPTTAASTDAVIVYADIQHKNLPGVFGDRLKIKGNFPDKIDKRLTQLNNLNPAFQAVQINESADIITQECSMECGRNMAETLWRNL